MALRVPAAMALCLLLPLMAVAHCAVVVPHEEAAADHATTKASSSVADGEGEGRLLRLPSREDSAVPDEVDAAQGEVPVEDAAAVELVAVAEPDPDRSHPDSEEELTAEKLSIEGQAEDEEKAEEQIIHDDEDAEDEKKTKEKKGKKLHSGDRKGKKKEKKMKKHHPSSNKDEDEDEKEKTKKIHRHHRVEKEMKTKKRPCHDKSRSSSSNNGEDSDDEDEHEKKARRWRKKAISRSLFGHGRRSQREEAAKEGVNN